MSGSARFGLVEGVIGLPPRELVMSGAYLQDGVGGADAVTAEIGAPLFETEDLRKAVETFLAEGPGKASFEGR